MGMMMEVSMKVKLSVDVDAWRAAYDVESEQVRASVVEVVLSTLGELGIDGVGTVVIYP